MVTIKIPDKIFYSILIGILFIGGIGFVYASTPSVVGHSASEVAGGTWTFPDSLYKFPQKVDIGSGNFDMGAALHIKGTTTSWPSSFIFLQAPANQDSGIRFYSDNLANFDNTKVHMYYNHIANVFKINTPVGVNVNINGAIFPGILP